MPDAGEIKAKVTIEYDGSGVQKAKEDLASLAEAGGSVQAGAESATEGFAALDEQMGKTADSTKALTSSIGAMQKPLEASGDAILGITDALHEQQSVIEDTAKSFSAATEPLQSFNEGIVNLSDTVGSRHFAENMEVFRDSLVNPEPYQMVQGYLSETGQTWSDFASSIGSDNMSIMKSNREFLNDLRSSGGSVFEMYSGEAVKSVTSDLGAFADQMGAVNVVAGETNKTISGLNKFGGIGEAFYGPEQAMMKSIGMGEAFANASESIMGGLNNIMMPMFAVQMIGMAVGQIGQGIYDMAAIAEGPAAHGVGTFTGTVDALGQSAQKAAATFSESFGQGVLPTLNAMNYQMSQGGEWGSIGGGLGSATGFLANLWQIGSGMNVVGGFEGLINQGAALFGLQQPFQGPGPASAAIVQQQQIQQQLAQSTAMMMAQANDPAYLAAQAYLGSAQFKAQQAQTSWNFSHYGGSTGPTDPLNALLQYQLAVANGGASGMTNPDVNAAYFNAFDTSVGGTSRPANVSALGALFGDNGTGPRSSVFDSIFGAGTEGKLFGGIGGFFGGLGQDFQDAWSWLFNPSSSPAPPPTSGCFVAGTRVLMADGSERPIETLQTGEQVLAHAGEKQVTTTVLAFIQPPPKRVYKLTLSSGQTLTLTNSHPISTTEGWKSLSPQAAREENPGLITTSLLLGDKIHTADGVATLTSILPLQGLRQVYNISVGNPNTFYANGVLVHNKTVQTQVGQQVADQIGTIQLPHIDLSGITAGLASAFSGISLPPLNLSGLTAGLASAFGGIALPPLPNIGAMLSGAMSGMFAGISIPSIPSIGSMISGAMSGMFGGISIPSVPSIGAMLSGAMSGIFGGLAIPSVPSIGAMLSGAMSGMFGGIALPTPPQIGAMLSGAMSGLFGGITLPTPPALGAMLSGAMSGMFGGISLPPAPDIGGMINGALSSMFSGISIPHIPFFARGVQNYTGLGIVGEAGPELVSLNGGSVYPLTQSGTGGSGAPISLGGGSDNSGDIYLHVQLMMPDGRLMAEQVIPYIAPMSRTLTGRRA